MALDGITTSAIVSELKAALLGGRIDKIHQPLADEIRMSIRGLGSGAKKIIISANSAPYPPDRKQPRKPYGRALILHGHAQAYRRRQNYRYCAAEFRAYHHPQD